MDGILGLSVQHSENTPHMHVISDTFGDDPKRPGMLRQDWSRVYRCISMSATRKVTLCRGGRRFATFTSAFERT